MPVVFVVEGYRFFFYSNEGDPREPVHVHVASAGADAKFWLFPTVDLAYNRGFSARVIRHLQDIIAERSSEIEEAWNDHFA